LGAKSYAERSDSRSGTQRRSRVGLRGYGGRERELIGVFGEGGKNQ